MASIRMFEVRYLEPETATAQIPLGKEEWEKTKHDINR